MDTSAFGPDAPGRFVQMPSGYVAFVPDPLPPTLSASWDLTAELSAADRAVARLAGILSTLPDPGVLVAPFVRREAVLSSRIEGTRASLTELLAFQAGEPAAQGSDVREVDNYVRALDYGLVRMDTLPLSLRLVRELHAQLMEGQPPHLTPGEFRRSQNWIGPPGSTLASATFVPPPPAEMLDALDAFEQYLHSGSSLPPLVRLGLIHYQFEAIHPFLDGNGRVGRLLVSLLLCAEGHVPAPVPYLSAFVERYRPEYYRLLLGVSQQGEWVEWLRFFLRALATQSEDGAERGGRLLALRELYRGRFAGRRGSTNLIRAVDAVMRAPVVTAHSLERDLRVAQRTAQQLLNRLAEAGVLTEATGRRRGRVFVAREVLAILD